MKALSAGVMAAISCLALAPAVPALAQQTLSVASDGGVYQDAERKAFYHWLLVDIPADVTSLGEGDLAGVAGRNSMGDRSKSGNGYDGPCPPFNDERVHTYHFSVYALDVATLDLRPGFSGEGFVRERI